MRDAEYQIEVPSPVVEAGKRFCLVFLLGATGHPHDKSSRKTANVILKEPQRLKDLPMTQHNEQAKTSEVSAMYEYYRLCISDSLADSSVAKAPSE